MCTGRGEGLRCVRHVAPASSMRSMLRSSCGDCWFGIDDETFDCDCNCVNCYVPWHERERSRSLDSWDFVSSDSRARFSDHRDQATPPGDTNDSPTPGDTNDNPIPENFGRYRSHSNDNRYSPTPNAVTIDSSSDSDRPRTPPVERDDGTDHRDKAKGQPRNFESSSDSYRSRTPPVEKDDGTDHGDKANGRLKAPDESP